MYGGLQQSRGSPPHAARAGGGRGIRLADSLPSSICKRGVSREPTPAPSTRPSGHRSEHRASHRSKRCARCGDRRLNAHRFPTEAHLDARACRGRPASPQHHQVPVLRTGTSAGFEPATHGFQAVALPRANLWWQETEHPCGTRLRYPKRGTSAPGGLANPLSLHERCFDLVTRPRQSAVPNPPSLSNPRILVVQNEETPVGGAFRGLSRSLCRGLPFGQPRHVGARD